MALRAISLFAGGGGLDLGVERACGARTVVYVEREAYAAATLAARMEEGRLAPAPIWSDVSTFDGRPWRGVVDLVHGGFPCQDVSNAGKRAGIDGERSGLWSQYARIVGEVRPRFVFVENVAALATRGLDRVAGDLAALGFDAEWCCLGADAVGAPHGRARLFLLAHSALLGEREPDYAKRAITRKRAWPNIGGRGVRDGGALADPLCNGLEGLYAAGSEAGPTFGSGGAPMAHAHIHGLALKRLGGLRGDGDEDAGRHADRRGLPWPPGPDDEVRWSSYLDRWPHAQPAVRRGADGVAMALEHRVDRLRLLGNGVVPAQACIAFCLLWERLMNEPISTLGTEPRVRREP